MLSLTVYAKGCLMHMEGFTGGIAWRQVCDKLEFSLIVTWVYIGMSCYYQWSRVFLSN